MPAASFAQLPADSLEGNGVGFSTFNNSKSSSRNTNDNVGKQAEDNLALELSEVFNSLSPSPTNLYKDNAMDNNIVNVLTQKIEQNSNQVIEYFEASLQDAMIKFNDNMTSNIDKLISELHDAKDENEKLKSLNARAVVEKTELVEELLKTKRAKPLTTMIAPAVSPRETIQRTPLMLPDGMDLIEAQRCLVGFQKILAANAAPFE
jgi:hypothetical protein